MTTDFEEDPMSGRSGAPRELDTEPADLEEIAADLHDDEGVDDAVHERDPSPPGSRGRSRRSPRTVASACRRQAAAGGRQAALQVEMLRYGFEAVAASLERPVGPRRTRAGSG
jgi:hypothetical protein